MLKPAQKKSCRTSHNNRSLAMVARLFAATGLLLACGLAQAVEHPLAGLDDYVKRSMMQWKTPGLAIAVVKDDKVIHARGYGTRTYGANQPVNKDTVFAIGSNSKYFTANALAILVAEGKIAWDDLMIERLPGFRVADDTTTSHATIIDALAHRTGAERGDEAWFVRPGMTRKQVLGLMKYLGSAQDFRSGYLYNNYMHLAAGEIVPEVTGITWDQFVKTRFFKPLGMTNSNTSITEFGGNPNVATPHITVDDNVVTVPWHNLDNVGPAGSINSSVADMAQWLRLHLNNGTFNGREIIPEEQLLQTRRVHASRESDLSWYGEVIKKSGFDEQFAGYGLAISIGDSGGYRVYTHGGAIDGMISRVAFVPKLGLGVVVLTNMANNLSMPLAGWIIDRFTDAGSIDRAGDVLAVVTKHEREEREKIVTMKQNAVANASPSRAPDDYAGVYHSDLIGELTITVNGNSLMYAYGEGFTGVLNHLHFDTFLARATAPKVRTGQTEQPVVFSLGVDGAVASLKMGDEIFTRKR